jgi:hypothetical protein
LKKGRNKGYSIGGREPQPGGRGAFVDYVLAEIKRHVDANGAYHIERTAINELTLESGGRRTMLHKLKALGLKFEYDKELDTIKFSAIIR